MFQPAQSKVINLDLQFLPKQDTFCPFFKGRSGTVLWLTSNCALNGEAFVLATLVGHSSFHKAILLDTCISAALSKTWHIYLKSPLLLAQLSNNFSSYCGYVFQLNFCQLLEALAFSHIDSRGSASPRFRSRLLFDRFADGRLPLLCMPFSAML